MATLTPEFMKERFDEIVGWPYASPGTNDERGIDCSGAFVRAYRKAGKTIAHGSNAIERRYCRDCFDLNGSTSGLKVGMVVWKYKEPYEDGYALPDEYRKGGEQYNGDLRDYGHIGLVTSVNPLRITHATSPCAKVDAKLGSGIHSWRRAGYLSAVDYNSITSTNPNGTNDEKKEAEKKMSELVGKTCTVTAESGSTVNLRKAKSAKSVAVAYVPIGEKVLCTADDGQWATVRWEQAGTAKPWIGYMMSQFLTVYDYETEDNAADETELVDEETAIAEAQAKEAATENSSPRYRVYIDFFTKSEAEAFQKAMAGSRVGSVKA